MIVNHNTLFAFNMPAGISRIAVLGFFASKDLSRYRLKCHGRTACKYHTAYYQKEP